MRKALFVPFALVALVAMSLGTGPATSAPQGVTRSISGTVSVDPSIRRNAPYGAALADTPVPPSPETVGCFDHDFINVRANQECTNQSAPGFFGRGQAQNEPSVAVNPLDPDNVIIGQNDYRNGDGACGVNFSLDGGRRWGSGLVPQNFTRGFAGGLRHYWTSGGDTSIAFDTRGVAYLSCLVFERSFPVHETGVERPFGASALVVFRSVDKGASWSFPGDHVVTTTGTGEDGVGLHDKNWLTADNNPNSPYADRLYMSWTRYNAEFTSAPIGFAWSDDHGVTWHDVGNVSGSSSSLCPVPTGGPNPAGTCDNSQFSVPFVTPNGNVYVVFNNYNNCNGAYDAFGLAECPQPANDNHFQVLVVRSTDGGETFGAPVKVGEFYDLPDCATYTHEAGSFGRACVPTAPLTKKSVFRATNYPSPVALSNDRIVITYGSYINRHSHQQRAAGDGYCKPNGLYDATFLPLYEGVGQTNGCNNDIIASTSNNGGASFNGTATSVRRMPVVSDENPNGQLADQFFQWSAGTPSGKVATMYYDRKYNQAMKTGRIDVSMNPSLNGTPVRVTNRTMPPGNDFPGVSGYSLFLGDYNAIAVGSDGVAHPAWPDTRNPIYTFDPSGDPRDLIFAGFSADIYTAAVPAP